MLGRLFDNLSLLTLNLLNPNDSSQFLLETTSFDLADHNLCFSGRLATGTRSRVRYVKLSLDKHLHIAEQFYIQFFYQFSASEAS